MNLILFSALSLGILGMVFAVVLAFLDKKLKVKQDERVEKILALLPGINCGACGFSGCAAFAQAVVKERKMFSGCIPGGREVNRQIASLMGIGEIKILPKVAVCQCSAADASKKRSFTYEGPQSCRFAHLVGGNLDCTYGCLGYGDCVAVCPVGAISIKEKKVYVDADKCIGCGKCIQACPRNLFTLVAFDKEKEENFFYVGCSNKDKGSLTRAVCTQGCIACGICVRVGNSPFKLENNLSRIDYSKAEINAFEEAKNKCPTKCIIEAHA